jgi:hypothetical protein
MGAVAHGEPMGQFACCVAAGMTPNASKAPANAILLRRRFMADIGVNRIGVSFPFYRNCCKASILCPDVARGVRTYFFETPRVLSFWESNPV